MQTTHILHDSDGIANRLIGSKLLSKGIVVRVFGYRSLAEASGQRQRMIRVPSPSLVNGAKLLHERQHFLVRDLLHHTSVMEHDGLLVLLVSLLEDLHKGRVFRLDACQHGAVVDIESCWLVHLKQLCFQGLDALCHLSCLPQVLPYVHDGLLLPIGIRSRDGENRIQYVKLVLQRSLRTQKADRGNRESGLVGLNDLIVPNQLIGQSHKRALGRGAFLDLLVQGLDLIGQDPCGRDRNSLGHTVQQVSQPIRILDSMRQIQM